MNRVVRAACVLAAAIVSCAGVARADVIGAAPLALAIAGPASLPAARTVHRHHGAVQDAVTAHTTVAAHTAPHHRAAHHRHHHILHHTARLIDGARAGSDTRVPLPGRPALPHRAEHIALAPHAPATGRISSHGRSAHLAALGATAPGCAAPRATHVVFAAAPARQASRSLSMLRGRAPPAGDPDACVRALACCVAGPRRSSAPATSGFTSDSSLEPITPADCHGPSCPGRAALAVALHSPAARHSAGSRITDTHLNTQSGGMSS